jgi:hypothetical protein
MHDKQFSVSETWNVMLIFFDELWGHIERNFSRCYDLEGVFIFLVHIDQECFREWILCCEKRSTNEVDAKTIDRENILGLIREFVFYFHYQLGFRLQFLVALLDEIIASPEKNLKIIAMLRDACERVSRGELWRREDQSKDFASYLANEQYSTSFDHSEAATITYLFLGSLLEKMLPAASEEEKVSIGAFLSILGGSDPATPDDWKRCCIRTCARPFNRKEKLTLEEVFAVTVSFAILHRYWFGFQLFRLVPLLYSMRSNPSQFKETLELWYESIKFVVCRGPKECIQ